MENNSKNLSKAEKEELGYDQDSKPVGYGSSIQSDGRANEMHGDTQLNPKAETNDDKLQFSGSTIPKRKDDIENAVDDEERIGNNGL